MIWLARRQPRLPRPGDVRLDSDIDYARIIHCASFRRLQGKTQILTLGDSDFYRTRLTHSLEVAQITNGIARQLEQDFPDHPATALLPDRSLCQAIGCAHDLGHPPFGHGGEVALNYCMRDHGGFEGNAQTLRTLARLECYSESCGANLTRRTLLGLLKYPAPYTAVFNPAARPALARATTTVRLIDSRTCRPPKAYFDSEQDTVDWLLDPLSDADRRLFQSVRPHETGHGKTRYKSLDCSIMEIADDIAYGVHDLEDAISLGLIDEATFRAGIDTAVCEAVATGDPPDYDAFVTDLFGDSVRRKRRIGALVHAFISATGLYENDFDDPLLRTNARLDDDRRRLLQALKTLVAREVIYSPGVQHLEFKGQGLVVAVFEALQSDPQRLLPVDAYRRFENAAHPMRVICDTLATMTDATLLKTYDRLFSPRMGSVFDRL